MLKTEQEIEEDFYTLIKNSVVGQTIRGKVYRSGMRPDDAKTEDAVVKFFSGVDTQFQRGTVVVHIYVPDIIRKDGSRVRDMIRINTLQQSVRQMLWQYSGEYVISTDGTPKVMYREEIDQHYINVRLNYVWVAS